MRAPQVAGIPLRAAAGFLAALLALVGEVGLTSWSSQAHTRSAFWVAHTLDALDRLSQLQQTSAQLDASARAFALTRDAGAKRSFDALVKELPDRLAALQAIREGPLQQARLEQLAPAVAAQLEANQALIGAPPFDVPRATEEALEASEQVRRRIRALRGDEATLLAERERTWQTRGRFAAAASFGGGAVLLVFVLFAASLTRKELRRRRELADFQERLVGIITHDLRSPLAAILAIARHLETRTGAEPLYQRLSSSARRIDRLTHVLSAFASAQLGGELSLRPVRTDLRAIVEEAIAHVSAGYPGHPVRIEGPAIEGEWDRALVGLTVETLVEDALQRANGEPIAVELRGDAREVELCVRNPGGPLPEARLGSIFEVAQGLTEGAQTVRFSSGLGLFLANQIARAHGGALEARSDPREGTTFALRLPADPPAALAAAAAAHA